MRRGASPGFTYLGLIILLAILGMVGAAGLKMGTLLQRAAAEEELLEIGAQFSEALRSYAAATPQGKPPQPNSLQDLLKDPRFPNPRRHLRKIFVDPVTGKAEWGIVWLGEKEKVGVIGVYSLSDAKPLKIANFDIRFQNMENKEKISDWKFGMAGGEGVQPPVVTPPNSMTGSGPGAAPSLFGGGESNVLKGGKQGDAAAPEKGEGAVSASAPGKGAPQPAEPPVAEETPAEDAKPAEPDQPVEAQSDEEKEAEARESAEQEAKDKESERDEGSSNTTKSTIAPPVTPPPEGGRRRR